MLIKQFCGRAEKSHGFINNSLIYLLSLLTFSTMIVQTFFSYTPLLGLVYTQMKTGQKDIIFRPKGDNRLNYTKFSQGLDLDMIARNNEQFIVNNGRMVSGEFIDLSKYSQLIKYSISDHQKHRVFVSSTGDVDIERIGSIGLPISSYLSLMLRAIDRYSLSDEAKKRLAQDLQLLITNNLTVTGEVEYVKIGPDILKKLKIEYGGDYYLFMDISTSFQYLFNESWKDISQKYKVSESLLSLVNSPKFSIKHFTKQIIANFHNRFETYRSLSEQQITHKINSYLNIAVNTYGVASFKSESPIKNNSYAIAQVNVIIYVLFNFIIFLFLALCYTALNSTMYIKMELERNNIIILKLLGANNIQLSFRIIKTVLIFIVISNIIGISASILFLTGLSYSVSQIIGRDFSFSYDQSTIFSLILVGFILPVFIATLYAYTGLKKVRVENLGEGQEQIKEVRAEVYVQDERLSMSTLVLAVVVTVYGYLIYFLLPSVFNNGDTHIMSIAFIVFLYGIVIGAIKLLDVFQYLFEKAIAKLVLFRLDKFLLNLILKNLSINRTQNKKISLVYMVSTISLIGLSLNAQFQIKGSIRQIFNFRGGHIVVNMDFKPQFYNNLFSNLSEVKTYSFISRQYNHYFPNERRSRSVSDMTKNYYYTDGGLYGVAGPFFPNEQKWRDSATYTQAEQSFGFFGWLNTEKGWDTAVVGQNMVHKLDLQSSVDKYFLINSVGNNSIVRYPMKVSTVNTKHLSLDFSFKSYQSSAVAVNVDVFKRITGIPDDQFRFGKVFIELEDTKYTSKVVNQIKKAINSNKFTYDQLWNLQSEVDSLESVLTIIKLSVRIILILFSIICFSSLTSTNYISVQNQARSIGMLLSLGLSEKKIRKIYKYETFILLLCSSIKSIIISHFIASIIVHQRDLFTNSDPQNIFQIDTYLFVILLAAISSYFSSNKALNEIFTKSISHLLKRKD